MKDPHHLPAGTLSKVMIGRAGVGLVTFHLSRLGREVVGMTHASGDGDLWAKIEDRPEVVEVKASGKHSWMLKTKQILGSQWMAFVCIHDGTCVLVRSSDVHALHKASIDAGREFVAVSLRQVHSLPHFDLRLSSSLVIEPKSRRPLAATSKSGKPKIVRRTLADGTVREYSYLR